MQGKSLSMQGSMQSLSMQGKSLRAHLLRDLCRAADVAFATLVRRVE